MTAIIIITLLLLSIQILTFLQIRKGFKQTDMQELLRKHISFVQDPLSVEFTEKEQEILNKLS